jgi:hypothetical protein
MNKKIPGLVSQAVDGLNDIIGEIADRFGLDILSVSHVHEQNEYGRHSYSATAVCLLNGQTLQEIGAILKSENATNKRRYCFPERNKLSINVYEINYN